MTFEIIKGDLFDPIHSFEGLAQGVNCQGVMGAGIAVPFRTKWPKMYEEYKEICNTHRHIIPGLVHTHTTDDDTVIFNLFSQIQPGKNGSYELLQRATLLMRWEAESRYLWGVGMPWIGCGIAGLEKHNVQHIFEQILGPSEVEFILVEQ